jgi:CO/xanthine dehydrogenase Mo-binding subunit
VAASPEAGARLVSANVAAAKAMPGVSAVITARDDEAPGLLDPVARYAGAPLAVVAAEDRELAERAAAALEIDVEAEGASFDVETSPAVAWAEVFEGDPDALLARCERIVEGTWRWPFALPPALERPATLAWVDEDGRLVLRATTAAPFALRARVARALSLPASGLRVVRPQVGAPFGALADPRAAALCAALAQRTGRPVSLVEDHDRTLAPPEAAHFARVRVGFEGGRLAAMDALLVLNLGAESEEPGASFAPAAFFLRGTGVPFRLDARAVLTGLPPLPDTRLAATRTLRFALEGAYAEAARASSRDPLSFRSDAESGGLREALRRLTASPFAGAPVAAGPSRLRRGRGIAVAGPWAQAGATATAALTSNLDGSFVLRLGAGGSPASTGEALVTAAAAVLESPAEGFSTVGSDTDSAPAQDSGAIEPRLLAQAVVEAAARLRAEMPSAGHKKIRATAEATITLAADDLPASLSAVLAEVEVDGETGLARVLRLAHAPMAAGLPSLGAWEEGQILAALPLVFGLAGLPSAIDAPEILRLGPGEDVPPTGNGGGGVRHPPLPEPLPDLLPAAVAALLEALRSASGVAFREVPARPDRLLVSDAPS